MPSGLMLKISGLLPVVDAWENGVFVQRCIETAQLGEFAGLPRAAGNKAVARTLAKY